MTVPDAARGADRGRTAGPDRPRPASARAAPRSPSATAPSGSRHRPGARRSRPARRPSAVGLGAAPPGVCRRAWRLLAARPHGPTRRRCSRTMTPSAASSRGSATITVDAAVSSVATGPGRIHARSATRPGARPTTHRPPLPPGTGRRRPASRPMPPTITSRDIPTSVRSVATGGRPTQTTLPCSMVGSR